LLACQLHLVDIYRSGYPSEAAGSAANLRVAKLPGANDRHLLFEMPTVIEMLQTFTSDVDCPTGGLEEVLNMLRFAISDSKVLDHLYSTFRDVLIYLDPDDLLNNDDLHEDLPENVDSEVMMTFLLRQV
jgi:hypothetical protein